MKKEDERDLKEKANEIRKDTLEMCIKAKTGHVTSSMSCAEILTVLYPGKILNYDSKNPNWDERDRFILSKGQASPILYATLSNVGFFPKYWLDKFCCSDGKFGVHLQCDVPGVEFTTGSLGHGLALSAGVALNAKIDNKKYKTFVLLGDAECYEGSIWESAMFIGHHNLNNLVSIIDRNGYGVLCKTENAVKLDPIDEKFKAFGWDTKTINGHSIKEVYEILNDFKQKKRSKPLAIIANTTKGEGIKCMQEAKYHGLAPTGNLIDIARKDLDEYSRSK
ncbi:MAG TPA: transketolase [Candidatus Paceibacterota bacterium]|nr:transketolase [Candidatus Paceibacterota bacterium]